jgi:Zn-dependent protease
MKLLLLLFAGIKFGKLAATGGTMLLSLALYAGIWGWRYAAGFVGLLFVHEMGHFIAARQRGLAVGAPMFIPFVGAVIAMKEMPRDAETEAYVAYGGPFLGTLGAFAVYGLARMEDSMLGLAIAYAGFVLNLFNLLPISPLDGGRITAVLGPRIWFLGAPLLVGLLIWRPNPVLFLVAIMALPQLTRAWRFDRNAPENIAYYGVTAQTRLEYTVLYLGLVVVLGLISYSLHGELESVR